MRRVMRRLGKAGPCEIITNGQTVWINGPQGGLIGRLSARGIDVHDAGSTYCIDCRQTPSAVSWAAFQASMLEHHGVIIPMSFKPGWCK